MRGRASLFSLMARACEKRSLSCGVSASPLATSSSQSRVNVSYRVARLSGPVSFNRRGRVFRIISSSTGRGVRSSTASSRPICSITSSVFSGWWRRTNSRTCSGEKDPTRAFLTVDSGFPLVELEEALQNGTPFVYSYPSSAVPALSRVSDWMALQSAARPAAGNLVGLLLNDPQVARLYWAMAKQDSETRSELEQSPGLKALLPYSAELDFYGSQMRIRSGHVLVPGGASAQAGWKELVGASPDSPGRFVTSLMSKDKGWLAAYFDTLSRVSQGQQRTL